MERRTSHHCLVLMAVLATAFAADLAAACEGEAPPPQQHDGAAHSKSILTHPVTPAVLLSPAAVSNPSPSPSEDAPPIQIMLCVLGFVSSCLVYVAPCITFLPKIWREGSVGERSALPYITSFFNCAVGILYGLLHQDDMSNLVILMNSVGTTLGGLYVASFLFYSTVADRLFSLRYILPGVVGYALVLLAFFLKYQPVAAYFRLLCAICGSAVPLVPLFKMPTVMETRSMGSMPPALQAGISLPNGLIWTAYANTGKTVDFYILVPSCLGVVSALIQLGLHFIYRVPSGGEVSSSSGDEREPLLPTESEPLAGPSTTRADEVREEDE